ncbi:AbrB/MazE/SpoVT family DNA-binding domain-containing protein (plasmid) [Paenibacillus peoriae]|uniref:AbrB/MazE/SpoVT family DNA-binding domain-containing protein n=1 Tax=Paenibacillus peoriae TaxID=59893 RepID=A0A7H0YHE8_9BACL|nr:AbrB/MazE/SpoVT family DNA-binding domain-containing protein [Paenibacillus peoriae]QNR70506.1 AbrB/MazE/SpoVT family DNA-binding domain-containing protein [Paenibacillus peoriae]
MKSTGMTRPLDPLGRIVLPKEMRVSMGIGIGDPLEIFVDESEGMLAFRRYVGVACKMCGSLDNLSYFRDAFLCAGCIRELKAGNVSQKPVDVVVTEKKEKRTYSKPEIMLKKLRGLMEEYPSYTQKQYADILGVSQCRVSQLKSKLREQRQ